MSLLLLVVITFFSIVESFSSSLAADHHRAADPPPPPPHSFLILRHGETDANAAGRIQGSSDVSRLTGTGMRQAARAGKAVFGAEGDGGDPLTVDRVYVSPLTRAQQTLSALRRHAAEGRLPDDHTVMHELHEIDLYDWEGQHKSNLKVRDPDAYEAWKVGDAHAFEVSGRKPILETWDRGAMVWDKIRKTTPDTSFNTLLVCHGTLGQALLSTAFGWDATHFRKHNFPNCGLVEVRWYPNSCTASSWRWHHPEPSELIIPGRMESTTSIPSYEYA
jgi:probable phosphoglycerate mutase